MNFFEILYAQKNGAALPANYFDLLFAKSFTPATEWGEYDGTLPAQYSANGSVLADYRVYGAAGGVGDDSGTEYGYEVDMSVSDGTTSTTTPIYIGDTPLGEDEYVSFEERKVYRRTENLFDISAQTAIDVTGVGTFRTGVYLGFLVVGQYTLTFDVPHNNPLFITIKNGSTYTHIDVRKSQLPFTFLVNSGDEIIIRLSSTQTFEQQQFTNICVTPGTTPPEIFVPYLQPTDPPVPLPALPTVDGTTITDYAGQSAAVPSRFYAKYQKG